MTTSDTRIHTTLTHSQRIDLKGLIWKGKGGGGGGGGEGEGGGGGKGGGGGGSPGGRLT